MENDSFSETPAEAARIIRRGGVIAFRTDTFYGLGADPLNQTAVDAIVRLKGREETKPILLLISDKEEVVRFIPEPSVAFNAVASHHWPGPITLVGIARSDLPAALTAGTGTVGVRLPADDEVRRLVRICGGALTATSANSSTQPPARTVEEVRQQFPEGIELIIDGGRVTVDQPSTVLDVSGAVPRLIREGVVKRDAIAGTLEAIGMKLE